MSAGLAITGDERGLLRGVLASPDDRTARLVYADWLDEHDDPRGPWVRAVCEGRDAEDLRSSVNPDWAALLDGRDHFTILLTAEIVDHLRETIPAGQALRELRSWGTAQSDFQTPKVKPGDHVYPIQLVGGQIRVLTRFRVAALRERTERFAATEPLPRIVRERLSLLRPSDIQILDAADSGLLDYDRALPRLALERLRYQTRRGERGLSSVSLKDGKLTNVGTVHGVFKLAQSSARDFGLLVFAPDLLDDTASSPPRKHRK